MRGGKDRSQKVRKVRLQDGSEGWRVAQEREVIRGWAPEARGAMAATEAGMASSLCGKRVGDMKGLEGNGQHCFSDREGDMERLTASADGPSGRDYRRSDGH